MRWNGVTVGRCHLQAEEQLVDARVIVELGMKRDADLVAVARGDDVSVDSRELDCALAHVDDARCP